MRYLPHTENDIASMMQFIGISKIENLFTSIPENLRMKKPLNLPTPMTEWDLNAGMDNLASSMAVMPDYKVFIGAGCYEHYVPSTISYLISRGEFLTAYTPYQPEISQGTLQGIYEYQTLAARLMGTELANGSMYDGASAFAESLLMAIRVTGKQKVLVSNAIHPYYREVAKTYLSPAGYEIAEIPYASNGKTDFSKITDAANIAAIAVQSPNFFGCIEEISSASDLAHKNGALFIATFTEPLAFGLYKNPGSQCADIVCGEGRSMGLSEYFGGNCVGMFGSYMKFVRNLPGRLIGKTKDRDGNPGFVITLSTREQHIRREKATSNICSNQSLCAIASGIYMSTLGKTGIRQLAKINYNKSEYLKKELKKAGFTIKFESPTFNEFVVEFPKGFESKYDQLIKEKIVPGLKIGDFYPELENCCLVCATETKTKEEIDYFVKKVKS